MKPKMNLVLQTDKSIDILSGKYISTVNENTDWSFKKTPNSMISKHFTAKNINNGNINNKFCINSISETSQLKANRLINKNKIIASHRESTKTPEKNNINLTVAPLSYSKTEKSSLKKYRTKSTTSFLSTSVTNCSHHKTNPNEVIEGNSIHKLFLTRDLIDTSIKIQLSSPNIRYFPRASHCPSDRKLGQSLSQIKDKRSKSTSCNSPKSNGIRIPN